MSPDLQGAYAKKRPVPFNCDLNVFRELSVIAMSPFNIRPMMEKTGDRIKKKKNTNRIIS